MTGWFKGTIVEEISDLSANYMLIELLDRREGTLGSFIPGV